MFVSPTISRRLYARRRQHTFTQPVSNICPACLGLTLLLVVAAAAALAVAAAAAVAAAMVAGSLLLASFHVQVYLKLEFSQFTGSFKERGARNALMCLSNVREGRPTVLF